MTAFGKGNTSASKLTNEQVWAIREQYLEGKSQGALARAFGIHVNTVGRIVRGESRGNIEPPRREPTQEDIAASQARVLAMLDMAADKLPIAGEKRAERQLDELSDRARAYGVKEDSE